MKNKRFTPTKAKLPDNERIIGGDASPKLFAKRSTKETDAEIEKWRKQNGK